MPGDSVFGVWCLVSVQVLRTRLVWRKERFVRGREFESLLL